MLLLESFTVPSVVIQGGAVGVLAFVFTMILTARLVPRRTVMDIRLDRDERLAEMREEIVTWRTAHERSEAARETLASQVTELLELGRTTDQYIRALVVQATERRS